MKIQNAFYTVGVIFIIVAIIYFTRQFIQDLPDSIKFLLLIISVIVCFVVAEILRGSDL